MDLKDKTDELLSKWGLRLIGFVFFMLVYLLLSLSSCSQKIITRTKTKDSTTTFFKKDSISIKTDTVVILKGDSILVYITDTITKYLTETKIVEKTVTIKEDCKSKQEVRQENRTKRDSLRYIYKTITDTVRIKERTQRQENRQIGRTNRNNYFWLLLVILSFLFGYNFKYLFNVKTKKQ